MWSLRPPLTSAPASSSTVAVSSKPFMAATVRAVWPLFVGGVDVRAVR